MDKEAFQLVKSSIERAIDQVIAKGSDDIFRPPTFSTSLEQSIIADHKADFRKKARTDTINFIKQANLESERVGPIVNSLVAKDNQSFRQVSWIDPYDAVKYLSVANLLFPKIEASRIPKEEMVVHSHRLSEGGESVFDQSYGYDSFRRRSGEISQERKGDWKVITDISNFFDRIGNHSLENHLLDIGCEKRYVRLLREILLFWAGDRRSYGIPVGSDASRIISEAVFIDIDRKLKERGYQFVRYVDDFRIFTETRADAFAAIHFLTSILTDEGLSLNGKKTEVQKIVDSSELETAPNQFVGEQHEVIDTDEKLEVKVRHRISGRTQISRYYKEPGKDAVKKIKEMSKEKLLSDFLRAEDPEVEEQLKLLIKFFVHADQDVAILSASLDKRITSIFYIADALIKEKRRLSPEKRREVLDIILAAVDWNKAPYPYQIPLLRLTATEEFREPPLARGVIDRHKISDNPLFLREVITLSYECFDRARVRTLALETYPQMPPFVKRSIYYAVTHHPKLSEDEKRPLLKNMIQHSDDWFLARIVKADTPFD